MSQFFFILFFYVLLPLEEGVILALLLRYLYERQDHDEETPAEAAETTQPALGKDEAETNTEVAPESPGSEPSSESAEMPPTEDVVTSDEKPPAEVEAAPDEPVVESAAPEPIEPDSVEEEPEDIFQNQDALAQTLGVGNIVDGMVHGDEEDLPEDLASRIEEESLSEPRFDHYGMDEDSDPFAQDDDILGRFEDYVPSRADVEQPSLPEMDEDVFESEAASEDGISPTAVGLLGEDFDFDAMLEEAEAERQAVEDAISNEESVGSEPEPEPEASASVEEPMVTSDAAETVGEEGEAGKPMLKVEPEAASEEETAEKESSDADDGSEEPEAESEPVLEVEPEPSSDTVEIVEENDEESEETEPAEEAESAPVTTPVKVRTAPKKESEKKPPSVTKAAATKPAEPPGEASRTIEDHGREDVGKVSETETTVEFDEDSPIIAQESSEDGAGISDEMAGGISVSKPPGGSERVRDLGEDRFLVESELLLDDPAHPETRTERRDVIGEFSDEMIGDTFVEPDRSEAAREFMFEEKTRPMFVRRHKRNSE